MFLVFVLTVLFVCVRKNFGNKQKIIYIHFSELLMTDFDTIFLRPSFFFKTNLTSG